MPTYRFKTEGRSRIGFVPSSDGKTVAAVVPRFWLRRSPERGRVLAGGIFVLPDKGEREIVYDGNFLGFETAPSKSNAPSLSNPVKLGNSKTSSEETDDEDSNRVLALILLLWKFSKGGSHDRADLVRLLSGTSQINIVLARALVQHIKSRMRELRRTYKPIIETTSVVKGRILLAQSAPFLSQGMPRVVCKIDEFSVRSVHYSALMCALESLRGDYSSLDDHPMKSILEELVDEAQALRAQFKEVASISRSKAIYALSRVPLPPQLRAWRDIFNYALKILQGLDGNRETVSVNVFVPFGELTEKAWEKILFDILNRAFPGMVTEQTEDENKLNSPWINAGKKKEPDLLIRKDNVDVILDAKYYDSVEKVLSSSSYQFLGYALLPWTNPPNIARSRRLMFAIPQRHQDGTEQISARDPYPLENTLAGYVEDQPQLAKSLEALEVEFPTVEALVQNESNWWSEMSGKISRIIDEEE